MDASGALDSFLGRLTTVLVNEAQLLGSVRGDVEFIKDEMESMNGLILHLTEAQHRDHQVRAWMKQVVGLTRDCEGNVELYVHYVGSRPGVVGGGLLGFLRRIPRFLRTMPARHRIATRIQELKVRARDVGDRRKRYGVTVPPLPPLPSISRIGYVMDVAGMHGVQLDAEPAREEEDLRQRSILLNAAEPTAEDEEVVVSRGIDTVVKSLSTELAIEDGDAAQPRSRVRVFSVLGTKLAHKVAEKVYQQHSSDVSTIFGCKAWYDGVAILDIVLAKILEQVGGVQLQSGQEEGEVTNKAAGTTVHDDRVKQLFFSRSGHSPVFHREKGLIISEIQGHLKGKRFLIVVAAHIHREQRWKDILDALLQATDGCLPGSAIIMTTMYHELALWSSPYKIINARSLADFYDMDNVRKLRGDNEYYEDFVRALRDCRAFARKMLLHLLYVNFDLGYNCCCHTASWVEKNKSVDQNLVMQSYNELPSKYRSCLLYLIIFPRGHVIRTSSLARRWIAEGLLATTTQSDETKTAADEAKHYWDVLFAGGFIYPLEISAQGNIKSCTLHHEVHKVIAKIAREVNIVDMNLPTYLAQHLSIHNRIVLPKSHSDDDSKGFAASLPSLAASPQWQLLKVLDLESCQGLGKPHLRSICKILLLKYLSLRNTDVTELPKQVKELQCLETLDVRQTKVRVLAKKVTVLPLLKHFLAGHKVAAANDSTTSEDSFSSVEMPICIEKMNNMEILSHVLVSRSKELTGIAQLLKLRKLGVTIRGKHVKLSDLFREIENLHRCLRSLSIRIDPQGGRAIQDVGMVDPLPSIPVFIERLNISGITGGGLRHLIQDRHKLTKITLCEAQLKEDDLAILGKHGGLQCVRLQHNSYTESEIGFRAKEFQSLNYLLVEVKDITKISFASGAAPKLERIVWSFARMDALSGLKNLTKLKKLELNGDCNPDPIKEELLWHPNDPTLKHKPQHQCQEDRSAAPTTSSSAP